MKGVFVVMFIMFIIIGLSITGGILGGELNQKYKLFDKIFNRQEIGIRGLNSTSVDDIINDCRDEDRIDKQLQCIETHINRFYYYVIRPDAENITFNTLMNDGGDCGNWAKLWEHFATEFNLEITPIRVNVDKRTAHRFSIFSNEEGYCKVDQRNVDCYIYG